MELKDKEAAACWFNMSRASIQSLSAGCCEVHSVQGIKAQLQLPLGPRTSFQGLQTLVS